MPKIIEWKSHTPDPKITLDWWKNKPTEDAFIVLDVEVPEGFEVSQKKGLSYISFEPNVTGNHVRIHLYAKPKSLIVTGPTEKGGSKA